MTRAGHKDGMSLIEVLAYTFLLLVVINLSVGVFVRSSRLAAYGTKSLDILSALDDMRGDFSEAVHSSSGVAEGIGQYETGPSALVLRMPRDSAEPSAERFAVFALAPESGKVVHMTLERNGVEDNGIELVAEMAKAYPVNCETLRFRYDHEKPEAASLISLEVETKNSSKTAAHRTYVFSAKPRSVVAGEGGIL